MTDENDFPESKRRRIIINPNYLVGKTITNGNFCRVHLGRNLDTNERVVIKMEPFTCKAPHLLAEYELYQSLGKQSGFPEIYHMGTCLNKYHAIVMELLGPSLEALFHYCNKKFSLKTVLMIADQLITRIQYIHERGLIYRDVKPANFLIGKSRKKTESIIHVVDLGLAKKYVDKNTDQHIPFKERKLWTGTARFMSLNSHLGREQSRRDDLESLAYVLLYLLRGSLPWQGLDCSTIKERFNKIYNVKSLTTVEELCKGFPREIAIFLKYARTLDFYEKPNYEQCKKLFRNAYERHGYQDDDVFEWTVRRGLEGSSPKESD